MIRSGDAGDAYPAAWTTMLTGTAEGIEADEAKIVVRLRDKSWLLDKPASASVYAGSNSLPNGLEGTASDIKGQRKPKCYGKVYNIAPVSVNTAKLTYEVGICTSIDAVYDRGAAITPGANYATSALLQAAATAAGTFDTCLVEGYFRLGTQATGLVTADLTAGAAAANRTTAQIIKQLALDAGLGSGEISSADVSALDSANSSVIGLWLRDESVLDAMDQAAASIGAWYGFDTAGVLRMGRLAAPSGSPVATLYDYAIQTIERRPPKDAALPIWRLTLGHSRNYVVQSNDLAGVVTAARAARLAQGTLTETAADAAVQTQWLLAGEMEVKGHLTAAADAASEASRQLTLYKARRDVFDVAVPITAAAGVDMMSVVRVVYPRFSLDAGKDFRVIGIQLELAAARITLTLWG